MDSPRRNFLFHACAIAGTATIAAVAVAREAPAPAAKPSVDECRGYRVSDHILKYYKTTEI
jgi:hypothetical protein